MKNKVLVVLEGGIVQSVLINNKSISVLVLDYDTEGGDESRMFDIPQDVKAPERPYTEKAYLCGRQEISQKFLNTVFKVFKKGIVKK